MKRILSVLVLALAVTACSEVESVTYEGFSLKVICLDGVKYYKNKGNTNSYLTPAYNQDNTLKTCKVFEPTRGEL